MSSTTLSTQEQEDEDARNYEITIEQYMEIFPCLTRSQLETLYKDDGVLVVFYGTAEQRTDDIIQAVYYRTHEDARAATSWPCADLVQVLTKDTVFRYLHFKQTLARYWM